MIAGALLLAFLCLFAVSEGGDSNWRKSTVYVIGTAKEVAPYVPNLKANVIGLAKFFKSYRVFIYSDSTSLVAFNAWALEDSNVRVIEEKPAHPSRTARIAAGRNILMKHVHEDAARTKASVSASVTDKGDSLTTADSFDVEPFVLALDCDEVNLSPLNVSRFEYVMDHSSEWDAVSFNRLHFYDIWSLRYSRFNFNLWNFGSQSRFLRDVIEADIVSLLDTSQPTFFPVYSAFNGLGVYKLAKTTGCLYNGTNPETFALNTVYNEARITIPEECEHVAFHRCMIDLHQSKIRIFSLPLFL